MCVCVCVCVCVLRGRQTDKKIKRLDAKVIGLGEGKEKKIEGKNWTKNVSGQLEGLLKRSLKPPL